MKSEICRLPIDLFIFCLINGGYQFGESCYYIFIVFNQFASSGYAIAFLIPICLLVMLALSGASLVYGGRKVSLLLKQLLE